MKQITLDQFVDFVKSTLASNLGHHQLNCNVAICWDRREKQLVSEAYIGVRPIDNPVREDLCILAEGDYAPSGDEFEGIAEEFRSTLAEEHDILADQYVEENWAELEEAYDEWQYELAEAR